jgi:hypothetical protein
MARGGPYDARRLLAVAILLGLLSTGLGKAMRLETLHRLTMSPPGWSGEAAPLDANRLALVIGNSNYPDADSSLPRITRDAEGWQMLFARTISWWTPLTMRRAPR